jgi:hypothetical protein
MWRERDGNAMTGVVRAVRGSSVRTLVEYGSGPERMMCAFSPSLWPSETPPEPGQHLRLRFAPGAEVPTVEVVPTPRRFHLEDSVAVHEARALLGFRPGDRVVIIAGPNPKHLETERHFLINAGWGECLGVSRLPQLFIAIGAKPWHVRTLFCHVSAPPFDPRDYGHHHIVFLGSTKSNAVLRDHYWEHWPQLCQSYSFFEESGKAMSLRVRDGGNIVQEFFYRDNIPPGRVDKALRPEDLQVTDHFVLARAENPYADDPHYQCILSCGSGTIGTGYGVVALTARRSVRALVQLTEGKPFHLVGEVEMDGFLDPRSDPVRLVWWRGEARGDLLKHAVGSPLVWDPPPDEYAQEEREEDLATWERLLEQQTE